MPTWLLYLSHYLSHSFNEYENENENKNKKKNKIDIFDLYANDKLSVVPFMGYSFDKNNKELLHENHFKTVKKITIEYYEKLLINLELDCNVLSNVLYDLNGINLLEQHVFDELKELLELRLKNKKNVIETLEIIKK